MNRRAPVIVEVAAPLLYVLVLAASVAVLLRGHNEPGGGFIGGLMAVCATIVWALARGPDAARRRLPLRGGVALSAAGVLMAVASGLPAMLSGQPFLTHWWWTLELGPVRYPLSTVLVFDLGVYLCVWGALAGYALELLDDEPGPTAAPGDGT